jgi:geranylgeranyl reductase family protein
MDSIMGARCYDVIVVGAGPSGTTAARQCALKGLKALLIEKKEFPRYKPCAGGVSQWGLSHLDFDVPEEIIEQECFGTRIFFKGRFAEASKPSRVGILVSRKTFDAFLLHKAEEAGTEVFLSTEARDFRTASHRVEVLTDRDSFQAQCLVIAEGALGRMARRIRGPYGQDGAAMSMVTEIASGQDEIDKRTGGQLQLHFDVIHGGYGWIFPHRGYYSVGVGGTRGRTGKPRELLRGFMTRQGFQGEQKLHGHLLPVGGIRRKVVDHRVVLVGDAAGFVDAFSGEGIGYAILSGKLAAETIWDALSRGAPSLIDLVAFQERCDRRFGARLRDAKYLARILHSLPAVFLRTVATYPEVVGRLLDLAEWKISYRQFLIGFLARMPFYLAKRGSEGPMPADREIPQSQRGNHPVLEK